MRGVAARRERQPLGPLPTVGMYLDEQPITTIQGALDIHIYDIARVEALAGPQGTLYGASSQSGTIRIITNKPDPGEFDARLRARRQHARTATWATSAEGFVNMPIGDNAAIRLVGWTQARAGLHRQRARARARIPDLGHLPDNSARVEDNYND